MRMAHGRTNVLNYMEVTGMNPFTRLLFGIGLIAITLLASTGVSHAAMPEPVLAELECASDFYIQPLGRTAATNAEAMSLVLVRVIIEPGGGIGPHTHPGNLVISVESGTFGFSLVGSHNEMTFMRPGENGNPATELGVVPGEEAQLVAGDWIVETGMVHSARAVGDEPAVVVFSGLIADGQPLTTCV
jgi:quercetin dioxygenase-like cupin family protein